MIDFWYSTKVSISADIKVVIQIIYFNDNILQYIQKTNQKVEIVLAKKLIPSSPLSLILNPNPKPQDAVLQGITNTVI